jgi:voltage-gated potassium channel
LIALSVEEIGGYFFVLMFAVVAIYVLFDSSVFFSLSLANFISIYTCVFIFFTLTNFQNVPDWAAHVGYTFPLVAFVAGAALRRIDIQSIVKAHRVREERHFGRVLRWLVPVFVFAILTFVARKWFEGSEAETALFLAFMDEIGATLFFVSHDVATFMLVTGILFEEFFRRVSELLVPAFAFLTFCSMLVIVFACVYRIAGRFSSEPQFLILGRTTELSSLDALYLSLITVSTVGYGEIVPTSNGITTLVSVQIVVGVLLLLFGFYELIHYTRGRAPRIDDE